MPQDERAYFQHRLASEVERARRATQPCAALAHLELAKAYRDKLASLELPEGAAA